MNKKFASTIAGASILIVFFNIISRGVGLVREILFANFFGLSSQFEFYLIAAVIPLTINSIILYLGQNYLIPAYFKIKEEKFEILDDFLNYNLILFFLSGIVLSILLYFLSDSIIALYFGPENENFLPITVNIFQLFLLSIPIHFVISFFIAVKQIHLDFKYPVYSQLLFNLSFIFLIIIFQERFGIYIIPLCYIAGSLIQILFLIKGSGIHLKNIKFFNLIIDVKKFVPNSLLIIVIVESIGQLYLITDRLFYSAVPSGGIAALNYSSIIFNLPISIVSVALSTALFPRFSQNFNRKKFDELEKNFNDSIKINFAVFLPITIIFLFYGHLIVKLLFERGEFSSSDTVITYNALIFYSASLVFYSAYTVTNKIIYVVGLAKNLLFITVCGILIKILLNFLLVKNLEQNGLALSTSISYIFFFFSCIHLIFYKLPFHNRISIFNEFLFHLINSILSISVVRLFMSIAGTDSINLYIEIILFCSVFILNTFLVKHSSVKIFAGIINYLKGKRISES